MVADLRKRKPFSQSEKQETLTDEITSDFEECMNNDLDVKSAFDSLYETISELHEKRQLLSAKKIKNVLR